MERKGDVSVSVESGGVATVQMHRPPNNFFDFELIQDLASVYEHLDRDRSCRVIVLCSEGKHFCAGADFAGRERQGSTSPPGADLYYEAVRLIECSIPVVAAVTGSAIGG